MYHLYSPWWRCNLVWVYVRFEVFTAATMKNTDLRNVTLCGTCKNQRFDWTRSFSHQGEKNQPGRKTLAVTTNCSTLRKNTNCSKKSHTVPQPRIRILDSHRRENLESHIRLTGWFLQRRRNVSPVRYELCSYIPEYGILRNHFRKKTQILQH
jgi:hypothetical protein